MSAARSLIACLALFLIALALPGLAQADFGIKAASAVARNEDESIDLRAGTHPFEYTLGFEMNLDSEGNPEGKLSQLAVDLPAGLVGNPLATPHCTGPQFEGALALCPGNTQIGVVHAKVLGLEPPDLTLPLYNLTPPLGVPFSAGFSIVKFRVIAEAAIRSGTDYGASVFVALPPELKIASVSTTVWGVPAAAAHDPERWCISPGPVLEVGCSTDTPPLPFLTLPTSCSAPLHTTLTVTSLKELGNPQHETIESLGEGETPEGLGGCERPAFTPTITAQPETTASDSPTGLHFALHLPQNPDPEGTATAHLRNTVLTLPAGLSVNASAADGLGACSPAQIGLETPPGATPRFTPGPAQCPADSKLGTVQVESPLVDHPLPGTVYLARQGENPFGSLIALYITVEDPVSGVIAKLPARVEPDPLTGQLRTVVSENPQLPFEDFRVDIAGGPRASLTTPPTCATYTTASDLTPWTAPAGPDAGPSSSFQIASGPAGAPCAGTEAQMPSAPGFEAGTVAPLAGAYSPLITKLTRANGSQRFARLDLTLPAGLSGKLAGVAQCSEAALAAAAARANPGEGALEQQSPSCPATSRIGTATVGAGSGSPFYVSGEAYLAGPYKGAPLSIAIITPAIAGPFDLGTVAVRAALHVDAETAQVTVRSDPIPQILDGIPLDIRSVAVKVDRPDFTLNPTSCEEAAITGSLTSTTGQTAPLANRFQVGGCNGLSFKPNLAIRFKGATHRRAHPKLIATLTAKPGEANTSFAQVKLPKAAFLDNAHIGTVCTRPAYAAETCPAGSIYGRAEALTPLLDYPLKGNVYLRSNPAHKLPDLVVGFKGPPSQPIKFDLAGKTDSVNGALRNTFEYAPDVPVSKFRLELFGGKRGLVELSSGLCAHRAAAIKLRAHSGKQYETNPKVKADCGGKTQKKTKYKSRR